jgi:hypothetical protein
MKISPVLKAIMAFFMFAVTLCGCDIETFDDASSAFNNNTPAPPPAPPPPGSPPPPPTFAATFAEIQTNVFTPSCATAGCHDAGTAAAALNLEAANSYAELVGIASDQDAGILRVAPNDAINSYLIQKMEGTAATGAVMPPGGALAQPTIDIVRQWISDGAMDDPIQPSVPIRVSSLAPASGAPLTVAPTQIVAGFDRELVATSVNTNTFILEASGGDGTFAEGNETQIAAASISVPVGNPQTAVFDLTGVAMGDDTYRVLLLGTGATVIMDLDGNALDGEFGVAFPSGNGVAGGVFEAQFSITTPIVIGPTLDQIQAIVFTPSCATVACHTGGGIVLPTSMDLSNADASFLALVGVPSIGDPALVRVLAGDPDNSLLIHKIEGNAVVGGIMPPLPALPLDPAVIIEIRTWITDGALR